MTKYVGWIALVIVIVLVLIFWKQIIAFFSPSIEGKACTINNVAGTIKNGVCVQNAPAENTPCNLNGTPGTIINGSCVANMQAQRILLPPYSIIVSKSTRMPYFYQGCRYGNAISYGRPSSPWMRIFRIAC